MHMIWSLVHVNFRIFEFKKIKPIINFILLYYSIENNSFIIPKDFLKILCGIFWMVFSNKLWITDEEFILRKTFKNFIFIFLWGNKNIPSLVFIYSTDKFLSNERIKSKCLKELLSKTRFYCHISNFYHFLNKFYE